MKCTYKNMKFIFIGLFLTSCAIDARPEIDLRQVLKHFMGPFTVDPKEEITDTKRSSHSNKLNSLQILIDKKLSELKDLFQDDDEFEEEEDTGHDETTIIEFYPKLPKKGLRSIKNNSKTLNTNHTEPFKLDEEKYKKIKQKIDIILAKDTLTDGGKKIIKNAIDDIINKLLKNQCMWKSVVESGKTRREDDTSAEAAMLAWKKQFNVLKKKYFEVLQQTEAPFSIEDLIQIFEGFNDFFSQVMNDINGMSKRYAIKCKLIDKKRKLQYTPLEKEETGSEKKMYRVRLLDDDNDGPCKNFKICSAEFSVFLTDLYTKLNDTIYSAFKNYAAMYDRDVNTENSEEGNMITYIINKTADALEIKLEKTYKRKINAITLDPKKDKQSNIQIINDFIKKVIETVNGTIHEALEKDFGKLSYKLRQSVKNDISVNVGIELGNLQRNTIEVCSMFEQCNGNSNRRSSGGVVEVKDDDSLVYVHLKVNVSDPQIVNFLREQRVPSDDKSPVQHSSDVYSPVNHSADGHSRVHYFNKHHKTIVTRTTTLKIHAKEHYHGTKMRMQ